MKNENLDLSALPHYTEIDPTVLPAVEEDILAVRGAVIGEIGRFRAGVEMYAPVDGIKVQGGLLHFGEAQVRHVYAELGKLVHSWDNGPRDLIKEADVILSNAGHVAHARASHGYDIETDGTDVSVYHFQRGGRVTDMAKLHDYFSALKAAGWTGPGSPAPVIEEASDGHPACVVAVPPALLPNP